MSNYKFLEEANQAHKTPPATAWDRIEAKLDETQPVIEPKTKTFSLYKWSAAAAIVVAFASIGIFGTHKPYEVPVDPNYVVTSLQEESADYFYSVESVKSLRMLKYEGTKS